MDVVRRKKDYIPDVDERGYMLDLQDLKRSYQKTLNGLIVQRKELEIIIEEDSGMTLEEMGEKKNRSVYNRWKQSNDGLWDAYNSIKESISDVNYVIAWLHTGKRPGNMRGIERRSVYQNTILVDPHILQSYAKPYESRSSTTLTDEQKAKVEDALRTLSPLERECFILIEGRGFSSGQTAEMMNLSKGTVDTVMKRAKDKFQRGWQSTLF